MDPFLMVLLFLTAVVFLVWMARTTSRASERTIRSSSTITPWIRHPNCRCSLDAKRFIVLDEMRNDLDWRENAIESIPSNPVSHIRKRECLRCGELFIGCTSECDGCSPTMSNIDA